jgi:hypothetical protein
MTKCKLFRSAPSMSRGRKITAMGAGAMGAGGKLAGVVLSGVVLAGAVMIGGCMPHGATTRPIVPPVQQTPRPTYDLNGLDVFQNRASQMPADNEADHRTMLEESFSDLTTLLAAIEGPDTDGAFRQQIMVIESTRGQLASLSPDLSSEPTIATGLRAAANALSGIDTQEFLDQPDILKSIGVLNSTLDELDTAHGTRHRQVVSEAVQLMGAIMRQMNDVLTQRLGSTQPTSAPTSQPAGAASQPATMP